MFFFFHATINYTFTVTWERFWMLLEVIWMLLEDYYFLQISQNINSVKKKTKQKNTHTHGNNYFSLGIQALMVQDLCESIAAHFENKFSRVPKVFSPVVRCTIWQTFLYKRLKTAWHRTIMNLRQVQRLFLLKIDPVVIKVVLLYMIMRLSLTKVIEGFLISKLIKQYQTGSEPI